jgi:integrase
MAVIKLTARYCAVLRTDAKRVEVRDAKTEGLEFRVTKAGSKTWALRYRRRSDSSKRMVTLGRFPELSLEGARKRALQTKLQIADGGDPAGDMKARKAADTFTELTEQWLELHAAPNKTPRTVVRDRQMLRRHVLPEIGKMKVFEIAKRDIIRLLDRVAAKNDARFRNQDTAARMSHQPNRVFELVRSIFRWGVSRDLVRVDPTAGLKPPIVGEAPRERVLSPAEIRTLWLVSDRAPVSREKWRKQEVDVPMRRATALAIQLAFATGQRIGELTGAKMNEFDLNDVAPVWTIPGVRRKNGQAHRVPLSPLTLRLIAEARKLADESHYLFPGAAADRPMDSTAPVKALLRARPMLGMSDVRVHDARRAVATGLQQLGVLPHVISHVLGHVSATRGSVTTAHYALHEFDREKRDALNRWATRLEAIVVGI